jgi:hypothetical protein
MAADGAQYGKSYLIGDTSKISCLVIFKELFEAFTMDLHSGQSDALLVD